jgi:hypothetical protein
VVWAPCCSRAVRAIATSCEDPVTPMSASPPVRGQDLPRLLAHGAPELFDALQPTHALDLKSLQKRT